MKVRPRQIWTSRWLTSLTCGTGLISGRMPAVSGVISDDGAATSAVNGLARLASAAAKLATASSALAGSSHSVEPAVHCAPALAASRHTDRATDVREKLTRGTKPFQST